MRSRRYDAWKAFAMALGVIVAFGGAFVVWCLISYVNAMHEAQARAAAEREGR